MRRLYRLATTLALLTAPDAIMAQQVKPAGVVAARHAGSAELSSRKDLPHAIVVDSAGGHPWRWIGTGALLGGATAGIVAGVAVSRSEDAFFPGPAIVAVGTVGAIVGGLVGGLAYAISHSARQDLHPRADDRATSPAAARARSPRRDSAIY